MKKRIDAFCLKHPNFGIQNIMKYIVIANVIFWLINAVSPNLLNYMTFNPYYIFRGQLWRLVSFIFIPNSTGFLALIAFYFYYFIGSILEQNWGTARFNIYFFTGVILTVVYGFLLYFLSGGFYVVNLNATYIYLSMFFSFAVLFPDMQVLLFFIIPIKMKWLALVDGLLFVVSIFQTSFPLNLLPIVALLNFFIFCGEDLLSILGIKKKKKAKVINFKKATASNLYRHKCAVCGRTDAQYPDLEFRYCSRCAGYHCFCSEHINNHIHFTE